VVEGRKMKKNYKLQKKVTGAGDRCRWGIENYKLQNTNYKQIPNYNVRNYKKKTKGSHGLLQGSFRLQTMTALIKSFCGGLFAKRKAQSAKRIIQLTLCAKRQALCAFPLAAGGKKNEFI
jgi:hypothetical protein